MFRLQSLFVTVVSFFAAVAPVAAEGPLDGLLRSIPADANVVSVIRLQQILESPRAQREGWAKSKEEAYLAGAEQIPPWLVDIVRATCVHLEDARTDWSVAVATTRQPADLSKVAARESSEVETIEETEVVKSVRDSYIVNLQPGVVATISPAFRQGAARWLRFVRSNQESRLSPWLAQAVGQNSAPVLVAIDTQDMLDPPGLRRWLAETESLAGQTGRLESVAHVYSNLRGITLTVTIGDETTADLTLDFGVPVGANGPMIKNTLLEYLRDVGAAFDDLEEARVTARGRTVILSTPVSDQGLRRIFSLVTAPNPAAPLAQETTPQSVVDARRSLNTSKRYLNAIGTLIDDLSSRSARSKNYTRTAVWHDSYAKQIEALSIRDVHPELADFGRTVSQRLRAIAASLRGVALSLRVAEQKLVIDYSVDPGGLTGAGMFGEIPLFTPPTWRATSNLQQVREHQSRAVEQGTDERERIWQAIAADRQVIRRKMIETFGNEFESAP